jgi:hypothetical protein
MSGWSYWLLYVKGYLQYREGGHVGDANVYLKYMTSHYLEGSHDAGLAAQFDDSDAADRLAYRFREFDSMLRGAPPSPITVVVREMPPANAKILYEVDSGAPVVASLIDGYHRLFVARLIGLAELAAEVIVGSVTGVTVDARITEFALSDDRVLVAGTIVDVRVDAVELHCGDTILARTGVTHRPSDDAIAGGPVGGEFRIRAAMPSRLDEALELTLLAMSGWGVVGQISLPVEPSARQLA